MTNKPIITRVAIEESLIAEMECDTAASHSVMSAELFKKLQRKLGRTLQGKKENIAVKLADGSISSKSYGSILLTVRAHETTPVKITFFVLAGPNNLLGRYALEQLWPEEYKALRDIAFNSGSAITVKQINCGGEQKVSSSKSSQQSQHVQQQQHVVNDVNSVRVASKQSLEPVRTSRMQQ